MRSEKSLEYILTNWRSLNHFCEIGVYEYSYCRLQDQIKAGKRVTLFECNPRCIADIKSNINGLDNVTLYEVAIYKSAGSATMTDVGASTHIEDGLIVPAKVAGYQTYGKFDVKTDTFDKYDDGTIDVLFIDTEGSEFYAIEKMISRPKLIEVETHYKEYKNPMLHQIQSWMQDNGYKILDRTESDTVYAKD